MAKKEHLEIYRQRYETFRHLDKLRWQMLQIIIALGSAFALVVRVTGGKPEWWLFLSIGAVLGCISWISFSINKGIRLNGIFLCKAGTRIGDDGIPNLSAKWKASSHWLAISISVLGSCFAVAGLLKFFGIIVL